jgi:hypothetical protein
MKVGVLGLGEIGSALCDLYKDHNITPIKKDLKIRNSFKELSVLNICIPYGPKFENIVTNEIIESGAKLTIIHSTVPVGTTANIKKSLTSYIVNSPVVGSHPFLKDSLESFVKYIGSPDKKAIKLAKEHYDKIGIKYKSYASFEATETAKLLCTTYYGLCITWHEYMKKVCDENDIDFSLIKEWNKDYNEGYKKFNLEKYNRPILNPPEGKIGGHCVIPNAKLLNKLFPSSLIKEILKLK